jgi:hypothetical protein
MIAVFSLDCKLWRQTQQKTQQDLLGRIEVPAGTMAANLHVQLAAPCPAPATSSIYASGPTSFAKELNEETRRWMSGGSMP